MNTTTTTTLNRREYIRANFSLTQNDDMAWVAESRWTRIVGSDRGAVIAEARRRFGHFNFDDEAEEFSRIFPPNNFGAYPNDNVVTEKVPPGRR